MDKWFDLHEKLPQISGEYRVILKGIDGQPDEEATAHCEVMFCGTVHRWTIHGVYEDRVVRWKLLPKVSNGKAKSYRQVTSKLTD